MKVPYAVVLAGLALSAAGGSSEESAVERAEALWDSGMVLEARRAAERQLEAATTRGASSEARLCNVIAKAEEADGRLDSAAAWRERALASAQASGEPAVESRIETEQGVAFWQRADYPAANRHCARALDLAREARDARTRARALSCLGQIEFKRGQPRAGRQLLRDALADAQDGGDRRQEAVTRLDLGELELAQRNFARAREWLETARAPAIEAGDVVLRARIEDEIGLVYLFQSLSRTALAQFRRSHDLAAAAGADAARAHSLMLQGQAYRQSRAFGRAIEAYSTAVELWRRVGNRREEAWTRTRLGRTLALLEDYAGARRNYETALGIWTALGDERARAYHLYDVGRLYEALGEITAASDLYHAALAAGERIELPYRSLALGRIARLLAARGDAAGAERSAEKAVAVALAAADREMEWTAYFDQAEVLLALGRPDEAMRSFERSLAILEELRGETIADVEVKAAYYETQQDVFGAAIALLVRLDRPTEALLVAERARDRAIAPGGLLLPLRLGDIRERLRPRGATAIEYFATQDRLYLWLIDSAGGVRAATVTVGARRLEELVAAARRDLRADRAALRWAEEELGDSAPAGATAVAPRLEPIPGEDAAPAVPEPAARSVARELYDLLIGPLAAWLPSDAEQPLFVVPHRSLFLLPFGLLIDPRGALLVERHAIGYLPSIASLRPEVATASGSATIEMLAVGDPRMPVLPGRTAPLPDLPAAGEEVAALLSLGGGPRVTLLRGAAASETAVRRLAPRFRVLHFATHGIARDDQPLESLLALSPGIPPDARNDGLWTAREILSERLNADLVTLSACDTGLGGLTGDGVLGLGRSFLGAGAAAVLVSLWRVEDSVTRYQMVRFYGELWRNGNRGAAALRRAQLDTLAALRARQLRDERGAALPPHPSYWAPFVLVGETPADAAPRGSV